MAAVTELKQVYADNSKYLNEFENILAEGNILGKGDSYVVDSLFSAIRIMSIAKDYETAVKSAVALGNDTDTTSAITGGLAGIVFGVECIPKRWIQALRGKDIIEKIVNM